jgi:hypothetical protein
MPVTLTLDTAEPTDTDLTNTSPGKLFSSLAVKIWVLEKG